MWLNSRTKDIPIRHLFEPANIRGVHHDHNYFSDTPEEHFHRDMNVTLITEDQCDQVQCKMRGQSMNIAWRHERTKRAHCLNFGRVCKATGRTDLSKLACSYTQPKIFSSAEDLWGQCWGMRFNKKNVKSCTLENKAAAIFIS